MKVRPCQSTTTLPKDKQGIYTLAHAVKAGMLPKTAVRQLSTSIYWITTCMESERQTFSLVRKSCVGFCVSNLTLKLKPNEENLTLRRQAQPLNKMSSDYAESWQSHLDDYICVSPVNKWQNSFELTECLQWLRSSHNFTGNIHITRCIHNFLTCTLLRNVPYWPLQVEKAVTGKILPQGINWLIPSYTLWVLKHVYVQLKTQQLSF